MSGPGGATGSTWRQRRSRCCLAVGCGCVSSLIPWLSWAAGSRRCTATAPATQLPAGLLERPGGLVGQVQHQLHPFGVGGGDHAQPTLGVAVGALVLTLKPRVSVENHSAWSWSSTKTLANPIRIVPTLPWSFGQ